MSEINECDHPKCLEYRQVAALVCHDLDLLVEAIKHMDSVEDIKNQVFHTQRQKDELIKDADCREMRYNATSMLFSLGARQSGTGSGE